MRRALEYAEKGVRLNPHSSDALYAHATMLHKKAVTAVKDAAVPIPAQMGLLDRAADAFRRLQVRTPTCCCVCRLGVDVKVGVLRCGFFGLLLSVMSRFASCQAQIIIWPLNAVSLSRARFPDLTDAATTVRRAWTLVCVWWRAWWGCWWRRTTSWSCGTRCSMQATP